MNDSFDMIDRADTMREAGAQLANEYRKEGNVASADMIDKMFDEMPDESAARLFGILCDVFGIKT